MDMDKSVVIGWGGGGRQGVWVGVEDGIRERNDNRKMQWN